MNVLAIIPARGGSKRIPRKNILPLNGKPLIAYTIEDALESGLVNRVIVSTDDRHIRQLSRSLGAEVIDRPREFAQDTSSSEEALLHVLNELESKESYVPDLVVFLQCTSPLREDADIDNAIRSLLDNGDDSLFSAFRFKKYVWQKEDDRVTAINYDFSKRWREQDFPPQFQENGSIYVFKPWVLREHGNRLGGKIGLYEMDYLNSFQVDSYDDIQLCECLIDIKSGKGDRS